MILKIMYIFMFMQTITKLISITTLSSDRHKEYNSFQYFLFIYNMNKQYNYVINISINEKI